MWRELLTRISLWIIQPNERELLETRLDFNFSSEERDVQFVFVCSFLVHDFQSHHFARFFLDCFVNDAHGSTADPLDHFEVPECPFSLFGFASFIHGVSEAGRSRVPVLRSIKKAKAWMGSRKATHVSFHFKKEPQRSFKLSG